MVSQRCPTWFPSKATTQILRELSVKCISSFRKSSPAISTSVNAPSGGEGIIYSQQTTKKAQGRNHIFTEIQGYTKDLSGCVCHYESLFEHPNSPVTLILVQTGVDSCLAEHSKAYRAITDRNPKPNPTFPLPPGFQKTETAQKVEKVQGTSKTLITGGRQICP